MNKKYPCISCGFKTNGDFICPKCSEVLCESCSDKPCKNCSERNTRIMKSEITTPSQKDLDLIASIKRSGSLGKYGIKGSTGLGVEGFFHIQAPYDSNGKVFVHYTYKRKFVENGKTIIEENDSWKRMTLARAKKEKRHIIPCSMCNKPAVSLDHLWPYEMMFNRCAEHYKAK